MSRYLHIGCGDNILPRPFENLDVRSKKNLDHKGPAFPLKFKDCEFDLVYASHVLEHFKRKDVLKVFEKKKEKYIFFKINKKKLLSIKNAIK